MTHIKAYIIIVGVVHIHFTLRFVFSERSADSLNGAISVLVSSMKPL